MIDDGILVDGITVEEVVILTEVGVEDGVVLKDLNITIGEGH